MFAINEDNINGFSVETETETENEWQKIDKALDNIKIGDIKCGFSLPIELNLLLEKLPRRIFSSKNYAISISPRIVSFKLNEHLLISTSQKEESSKTKPKTIDIINEGEANFKLFLGAYLGAMQKSPDNMKMNISVWFQLPLEEKIVSLLKAPVLDRLKENMGGRTFMINGISFWDENTSSLYKITQDLNTQKIDLTIEMQVSSSPTGLNFAKLLSDLIKQGNDLIMSVRA